MYPFSRSNQVKLHKNLRLVTTDKCLVERRLTATRRLSKALEAAMMHFNK